MVGALNTFKLSLEANLHKSGRCNESQMYTPLFKESEIMANALKTRI